jgi:hypothetical protein
MPITLELQDLAGIEDEHDHVRMLNQFRELIMTVEAVVAVWLRQQQVRFIDKNDIRALVRLGESINEWRWFLKVLFAQVGIVACQAFVNFEHFVMIDDQIILRGLEVVSGRTAAKGLKSAECRGEDGTFTGPRIAMNHEETGLVLMAMRPNEGEQLLLQRLLCRR